MPPKRRKKKTTKKASDPTLASEFANLSVNERAKMAVEAKNMGNAAFAAGKYREAVGCFTDAVQLDPKSTVYLSNRSATYIKLGENKKAQADAEKCIALDKNWVKGYIRNGAALFAQEKYEASIATLKLGEAIEPENKAIKDGIEKANAEIARI